MAKKRSNLSSSRQHPKIPGRVQNPKLISVQPSGLRHPLVFLAARCEMSVTEESRKSGNWILRILDTAEQIWQALGNTLWLGLHKVDSGNQKVDNLSLKTGSEDPAVWHGGNKPNETITRREWRQEKSNLPEFRMFPFDRDPQPVQILVGQTFWTSAKKISCVLWMKISAKSCPGPTQLLYPSQLELW